jgi:4-carboxymuconolactone decarboxylase
MSTYQSSATGRGHTVRRAVGLGDAPFAGALYDDMVDVIERDFGELVARRQDGALVGSFNGWLHFPRFGRPAWALNRSLWERSVLPADIHQLVILVTAAKFRARYEIDGHAYFAQRAGLSEHKIATIVSGGI